MNDRIREIERRKLEREIDRNLELAIKFEHNSKLADKFLSQASEANIRLLVITAGTFRS